jgi:ABC-type phosphate transport system substrate-binding protein
MTRKQLACSIFATALSVSAAHAGTTTINAGGSSLAAPTYIAEFKAYTATHPLVLFSYEAVGSGGGQKAVLNNDITQFKAPNVTSGTLTYGTIVGTTVAIGGSDATLAVQNPPVAPYTGLTNAATGSYGSPTTGSAVTGPMIQIPTFGTPIVIPYNEAGVTSSNGLTLNDAQICGVLSGRVTDWHNLVSTMPVGTHIKVVYRSDSSGTTFLLTQHLNAVCNATNSTFKTLPVAITKTFASLFPNSQPPANFTGASGSQAVADLLVSTSDSFGYLSPDYTSIAPMSASTTSLKVAKVVNGVNKVAYLPSVANTVTGLTNAGAGATHATPPATLTDAMNPTNWVPSVPVTTAGYPIVGYTTMDIPSCFANKNIAANIITFMKLHYNDTSYQTIIKNNGFAPLANTSASPFRTAVLNTFLSNVSAYNLNIQNTTTCASYSGR